MLGTVDLITFAIQAAVHLAKAGRKVYVEDTILRDLGIPLPATFRSDAATAIAHAEWVKKEEPARYDLAFRAAYDGYYDPQASTEAKRESQRELIQSYLVDLGRGRVPAFPVNAAEIAGIAALRQWEPGKDPFPHPLQRVAGALVEVAIDYCLQVPGAVQENSRHGRTIRAFLDGLDEFSFQEERWDSIVVRLFTAALDTASEHPEILPGSDRAQRLLTPLLKGVAGDVQKHLEALDDAGDLDAEARIASVGESLLRSLLRNAGSTVVRHPAALGVGSAAGRTLIQDVGTTFIDLVLPEDARGRSLGETLEAAFSGDGMDRLVGSALKAVVQHPESFPLGSSKLQPWLKDLLGGLYENHRNGESFFDKDLYIEVANLVLETGLRDLPLLLGATDGAKGLLVEIARDVYDALRDAGAPNSWKLNLGRADVTAVFSGILRSVAEHPEWIERDPDRRETVAAALKFGVQVLTGAANGGLKELIRKDLLPTVLAAALRSGVLDRLADTVDASKVAGTLSEILAAVEEAGTTGLAALLEFNRLSDLLGALAEADALTPLLGANAAAAKKEMKALLAVVDAVRRGKVLSIPEMVRKLKIA